MLNPDRARCYISKSDAESNLLGILMELLVRGSRQSLSSLRDQGEERFGEDIENPLSSNAAEKTTDEERAEIIALIDSRLQTVSSLEKDLTARDKLQTEAKTRSYSSPAAGAIDTLLRYESQLARQLYRAMSAGVSAMPKGRRKFSSSLNFNFDRRN
jgi:hypothetical protein